MTMTDDQAAALVRTAAANWPTNDDQREEWTRRVMQASSYAVASAALDVALDTMPLAPKRAQWRQLLDIEERRADPDYRAGADWGDTRTEAGEQQHYVCGDWHHPQAPCPTKVTRRYEPEPDKSRLGRMLENATKHVPQGSLMGHDHHQGAEHCPTCTQARERRADRRAEIPRHGA